MIYILTLSYFPSLKAIRRLVKIRLRRRRVSRKINSIFIKRMSILQRVRMFFNFFYFLGEASFVTIYACIKMVFLDILMVRKGFPFLEGDMKWYLGRKPIFYHSNSCFITLLARVSLPPFLVYFSWINTATVIPFVQRHAHYFFEEKYRWMFLLENPLKHYYSLDIKHGIGFFVYSVPYSVLFLFLFPYAWNYAKTEAHFVNDFFMSFWEIYVADCFASLTLPYLARHFLFFAPVNLFFAQFGFTEGVLEVPTAEYYNFRNCVWHWHEIELPQYAWEWDTNQYKVYIETPNFDAIVDYYWRKYISNPMNTPLDLDAYFEKLKEMERNGEFDIKEKSLREKQIEDYLYKRKAMIEAHWAEQERIESRKRVMKIATDYLNNIGGRK